MLFPQATYFDQKFHATFFLAAEEAGGGGGSGASCATQAAALLRRLGPPRAPLAPLPLDANQGSHNPGSGQEGERGRVQHGPVPQPRTGLPAAAAQRSGGAGGMQAAGARRMRVRRCRAAAAPKTGGAAGIRRPPPPAIPLADLERGHPLPAAARV